MPTPFPGVLVKQGNSDKARVSQIQDALAAKGYGPFPQRGVFDDAMASSVKLFQSQNVDVNGHALVVDGQVGYFTWSALFGADLVTPASQPSPLMLQSLAIAATQIGQMEQPVCSNRGPMVDQYLRCVGSPLDGSTDSRAWCMAFVYWCFREAATGLNRSTPLQKTAGCLDQWNRAAGQQAKGVARLTAVQVFADPTLVKPGLVFVHDHGHGLGHTGIVERLLPGGRLVTIEGNTNNDGSRAGVGVFRLERRKLNDDCLAGFIDYTRA